MTLIDFIDSINMENECFINIWNINMDTSNTNFLLSIVSSYSHFLKEDLLNSDFVSFNIDWDNVTIDIYINNKDYCTL